MGGNFWIDQKLDSSPAFILGYVLIFKILFSRAFLNWRICFVKSNLIWCVVVNMAGGNTFHLLRSQNFLKT